MLGLKMDKPKNCMYCPVRMDCRIYVNWLFNIGKSRRISPKSMQDPDCLLVDLDYLEDDLK